MAAFTDAGAFEVWTSRIALFQNEELLSGVAGTSCVVT